MAAPVNRRERRREASLGRLLKVSVMGSGSAMRVKTCGNPQRGGGKRGVIGDVFSAGSRRRMLETIACMAKENWVGALFVTLTYQRIMKDGGQVDRNVEELHRRILARYGGAGIVAAKQWQERGSLHVHALICGPKWIHKGWLQEAWGSIIGQWVPFTRVERMRTYRGAMVYMAKYMAKEDDDGRTEGGPGRGAASAAACPGSSPLGLKAVDVTYSRGRHWGIKGRKYLTEGIVVVGAGSTSPKQLARVRVFARAIWKGVGRLDGFSLFVENGPEMANLFCLGLGLRVQVCHTKGEVIAMWLRFMQEESNVQFNGEKTDGVIVA